MFRYLKYVWEKRGEGEAVRHVTPGAVTVHLNSQPRSANCAPVAKISRRKVLISAWTEQPT
jgi:hypothetical protein